MNKILGAYDCVIDTRQYAKFDENCPSGACVGTRKTFDDFVTF